MKKPHVLMLIDSLGEGGAQKIVGDIIKGCSDRVVFDLVALYWFDFQKSYYETLAPHCRSIQTLGLPTRNKIEKALYRGWVNLTMYRRIHKLVSQQQYAAVHTHLCLSNSIGSYIKNKIPDLPVVATYHSNFAHLEPARNTEIAHVLRDHDWIYCDLEAGYDDLKVFYGDSSKLSHLPFGIDKRYWLNSMKPEFAKQKEIRMKLGIASFDRVFLSIARIDFFERKIDKFIASFRDVEKEFPNSCFLVVGTGKDLGRAKQMVQELGLNHCVIFCGHQSDLVTYYAASDYYFSYTCGDEIGVAGQQAIAAGLVTFTLTMNADTRGTKKYFIDALDEKELAASILQVLSNDNVKDIGSSYSNAIINDFDNTTMVHEYLNCYLRCQ